MGCTDATACYGCMEHHCLLRFSGSFNGCRDAGRKSDDSTYEVREDSCSALGDNYLFDTVV